VWPAFSLLSFLVQRNRRQLFSQRGRVDPHLSRNVGIQVTVELGELEIVQPAEFGRQLSVDRLQVTAWWRPWQEPHEQEDHDVNRALAPVEDNVGHFGKCEECVDEHDEGG